MVCNVRGIPVFFEEYGEGKPVLCIHGYTVDHRLMSGCMEPVFCKMQGYRRIYLDLPGMGKTPSAECIRCGDDMLELLAGFIDTVIPDETFLIAGESYGGYMTLGLVHKMGHRIDGVMLLCPAVKRNDFRTCLPPKCVLVQTGDLNLVGSDLEVKSFLEMAVIATRETFGVYKRDILSGISLSDTDFLTNNFDASYCLDFERAIETTKYEKPVCILTGRQDHVVGYMDAFSILDRFPRATFSVLDCGGHNLQIEVPSLFNEHVRDWLWRVELGELHPLHPVI